MDKINKKEIIARLRKDQSILSQLPDVYGITDKDIEAITIAILVLARRIDLGKKEDNYEE